MKMNSGEIIPNWIFFHALSVAQCSNNSSVKITTYAYWSTTVQLKEKNTEILTKKIN